jgi:REP element-mobilizing transposase RayT
MANTECGASLGEVPSDAEQFSRRGRSRGAAPQINNSPLTAACNGHLISAGGIQDHLHLLVNLPPTVAVSKSIQDIKSNASKWVNETFAPPEKFRWQIGYGAFSVSYSIRDAVDEYIRSQQVHHRKKTFEEEYVEFLNRHDIRCELRYLFDDEDHG